MALDEETVETVEQVLNDYLDQVDPEDVDTRDLAENIVRHLERRRGEGAV